MELVRIVCDLPYLPEKRARDMDFNVLYLALERKTLAHNKMQEKDMEAQFNAILPFTKLFGLGVAKKEE